MGKRIALWDNLKLFLIFLVVLGHLSFDYFDSSQMFRTISMVIYTFHMPAFVFVSGLFCKRSVNSDSPPIKRFFSFMMLYLFARILNYINRACQKKTDIRACTAHTGCTGCPSLHQ